HSHHAPDGAAGACIACHMPKKNMALDGRLTPYHRIGSPTDPLRVLGDRPLECALCHVDKTVAEIVGTMERWWGKAYERAALAPLRRSLRVRSRARSRSSASTRGTRFARCSPHRATSASKATSRRSNE